MTPERWQQITGIFHAALGRHGAERAAFVDSQCRDDALLRREVESMLAAHDEAGGSGHRPLMPMGRPEAGSSLPQELAGAARTQAASLIGRTLAHYRILAKIGAGGMGEVYLAEDTTLNRRVALKVLPPEVAANEDRRNRFSREAKALAALNHPNIVTVHSVEEDDGVHFITMELVKGKTLAQLLPRQGMSLDRFFEIAVPLAEAIAAAHEQRIVHRDLKPGNVMLADDGRVKVLDFGLAKPTAGFGLEGAESTSDLPTAAKTAEGVIVGTCQYMSPEQAREQAADPRSDIFSLGIIFYEMLTGRRPFAGDTPAEALSSIIKDVPPAISDLRAGLPRELTRLVRRCLSKEPARRLQSALDLRNELAELKRDLESGELLADARPAQTNRSRLATAILASAAASVAALAGLSVWTWTSRTDAGVPRLRNAFQVTAAQGVENYPTWSPDGGRVAFVSDQGGNQDIWVTQLAGGSAANFTAGHAGFDRDPSWSPDGNQIAFVSERDGGGIYVMPAIGGLATRISANASAGVFTSPQWSSDGTEIAYLRQGGLIEVVSLRTRETRRLVIPGGDTGNRFDLSWSADGRFFAYVRAPNREGGISRLWVLRASDTEAVAVTDGTSSDWSPIWSTEARTLFFLSNRGGSKDLWQQTMTEDGRPEGEPIPITVGIGMQQAALTADGRKLAYSKGGPVANVWRVPLLADREAVWADAEQLTFDQANVGSLDVFPDGKHLLVTSDRGGNEDIWKVSIGGNEMRQLTADRAPDQSARLSPNGQQIVFHSYRSSNRDIWVVPTEGGPAVQLTHEAGYNMSPSWSPDGRNVLFYSDRTGDVNAFAVPASGGDARQITTEKSDDYFPQCQYLYFTWKNDLGDIWVMDVVAAGND